MVVVAENWNQILLDKSWPYSLLMLLLYKAEVDVSNKRIVTTALTNKQIISTSLKFTRLLEKNELDMVSVNQKLMYLMLVYFETEDMTFLDPEIKQLVLEKIKAMKNHQFPPRFNVKLNKEKSFESIYTMFLTSYQSHSYGDDVFSMLVMIPLAQKYDVKWRKLVWSEHVMAMRFIRCKETDLLENFRAYLEPLETDDSLLKSYALALTSGILEHDSIPYKIAEHHLKHRHHMNNQTT